MSIPLQDLSSQIREQLHTDPLWSEYLQRAPQLHLAVLVAPFLDYILQGRKTVESRFGDTRGLPFGRIMPNDLIMLKRPAGPVVGIARVSRSMSMRLSEESWPQLQALSDQLCVNDQFWSERRHKRYATIAFLDDMRALPALLIEKTDRRGWVILPPVPPTENQGHQSPENSHDQ
jgi:ASC-1-like (ASCH) protein